jgi:hypothetical protein
VNKRKSPKNWQENWLQNDFPMCLKMVPTLMMKLKDWRSKVLVHHETTIMKVIQVMMGSSIFISYTWTFETQRYLWDKI